MDLPFGYNVLLLLVVKNKGRTLQGGSSQDVEAGGKDADAPRNREQHASLQEQQTQRDPGKLTCTKWWGVR
jgi:hypothetical protein